MYKRQVDLDGFKRINDTRGHAAGDRLLITVTEILREHTAGDDIVAARFGGEEFLVCGRLDDTATAALAERIRLDVAALPDAVTVSIGSALATIGDITDQEIMPLVNRLVEAPMTRCTAPNAPAEIGCNTTLTNSVRSNPPGHCSKTVAGRR